MKTTIYTLTLLLSILCTSCSKDSDKDKKTDDQLYFEYTIDGKEVKLAPEDVLTSFNQFSATDIEFKIFAGKEKGPQLVLTIVSDISKPSRTPNGTPEASGKLVQGSVSLQDYPEGYTLNNYDYLLSPKPAVVADAIVITGSELVEKQGRIITGTINTTMLDRPNPRKDPNIKAYVIKGKFRILHKL